MAIPTFLFLSYHINKDVARHPVKRLSPIRRWLTYLTLFIASCVLIGDVTALIYNALGGELTSRLALKVLTVGASQGRSLAITYRISAGQSANDAYR